MPNLQLAPCATDQARPVCSRAGLAARRRNEQTRAPVPVQQVDENVVPGQKPITNTITKTQDHSFPSKYGKFRRDRVSWVFVLGFETILKVTQPKNPGTAKTS